MENIYDNYNEDSKKVIINTNVKMFNTHFINSKDERMYWVMFDTMLKKFNEINESREK